MVLALSVSTVDAENVRVRPGLAPPGTELFAYFESNPLVAEPDPCVEWRLAEHDGELLLLQGFSPAAGMSCPDVEQVVALGALPAGRYTLEARIVATGAVFSRVVFVIGGDPILGEVAVLPARPTPESPVSFGISLLSNSNNFLYFAYPPRVEGDRITIESEHGFCDFICLPAESYYDGFSFAIPALSPGLKTVEFVDQDRVFASLSFTVAETTQSVFLGDRFQVQVRWRDQGGAEHQAQGIRLTEESGAFTFFDSANVELVVKVLDGRGLNGHFWVFAASMTDLPYTLTVTEYLGSYCDVVSPPCPTKVYEGPAGVNRNVIDTQAFAAD